MAGRVEADSRLLYGQRWREQMGGQRRRLIAPKWVPVKMLRNKLLFASLPPSSHRIIPPCDEDVAESIFGRRHLLSRFGVRLR